MKILFLCGDLDRTSGYGTYASDHIERMGKRGHTICVLCHSGEGKNVHAILPPENLLLSRPWIALAAAIKTRHHIRSFNPDCIHITVEPFAFLLLFIGKRIAKKSVLTIHGTYGIFPLHYLRTRYLMRWCYTHIAKFITVSNYTKNAVTDAIRHHCNESLAQRFHKNATVVHNGIQITLPPEGNQKKIDDKRTILHVGGVKYRKGALETVIGCAEYAKRTHYDWELLFVGTLNEGGPYVQNIHTVVSDLHLKDHIKFLGRVSDKELQELYKRADLFLMPSLTTDVYFEGFGLVYLEANALGIPVIGPNTSGAAEAIEEGVSGYHVDPKKPEMIAERMQWILEEKRIDKDNCRKWAEEHNIENTLDAVEHICTKITA